MQKKLLVLCLIVFLAFTFISCKNDEATSDLGLNHDLLRLLPDENFQWAYFGADDYYHEMVLNTISMEEKQAIYSVSGEVEKVSGNSGIDDYSIDLYYVINHDSIIQNKTEQAMFDSEYDKITLIKTPLEKGNKWSETLRDKNNKKVTITSEIIEINEVDGRKEYKVLYVNKDDNYSEIRRIMEEYGVIAFTKSVEINDEKYNYGYGLYGKNSGYMSGETDLSDSTDSTDTEETTDSSSESSDDQTEDTQVDDKVLVKEAIQAFNDAWIEFVNENDQSFFDTVTKTGVAYKNAKKFNKTGLKEAFLIMDIKENTIVVNGNVASVKVYEEIEKNTDGEITIAKYNWLYDLKKIDGKWLVNGYTKQN